MSAPRGRLPRGGGKAAGRDLPRTKKNLARNTSRNSIPQAEAAASARQASFRARRDGATTQHQPKPSRNAVPPRQNTVKQPLGTLPAWRDPSKTDGPEYKKRMSDLFQKSKVDRERERKDAIENGFLADPDKPTSLADAITPVGTCPDMCPEFERVERIVQNMVEGCEKISLLEPNRKVPCEAMMVKRFKRSAAGTDDQIPSDIRPPHVLKRSLEFLLDEVVGGSEPLANVHKYVWDRTRAIRNDFSIQQVTRLEDLKLAIECFECIARFHIVSLHQLSHPTRDNGGFDAHQEREQLNNTLLSLMYYYDDSRSSYQSPNEAEFRAYCIIFEIEEPRPDVEHRAQGWPKQILKHPRVQTALKLYAAAGSVTDTHGPFQPRARLPIAQNFYTRFWSIIASSSVSYLTACVAEMYFNHVRGNALGTVWKAFKGSPKHRTEDMVLGDLTIALGFDNEEQTQKYCEDHGFTVGEREDGEAFLDLNSVSEVRDESSSRPQLFSTNFVESKRCGRTLPAIIQGLSVARCKADGLIDDSSIGASEDEKLFVSDGEISPEEEPPEPKTSTQPDKGKNSAPSPADPFTSSRPPPAQSASSPFLSGANATSNPFSPPSTAPPLSNTTSNPFAKGADDWKKNPFTKAFSSDSSGTAKAGDGGANKAFVTSGFTPGSTTNPFKPPANSWNPFVQAASPFVPSSTSNGTPQPAQYFSQPNAFSAGTSNLLNPAFSSPAPMAITQSPFGTPVTSANVSGPTITDTAPFAKKPLATTVEDAQDDGSKPLVQPSGIFSTPSPFPTIHTPFDFTPLQPTTTSSSSHHAQSGTQPESDISPHSTTGGFVPTSQVSAAVSSPDKNAGNAFQPFASGSAAFVRLPDGNLPPSLQDAKPSFAPTTPSYPSTQSPKDADNGSLAQHKLEEPAEPSPQSPASRDTQEGMNMLAKEITLGDRGILEQYIESVLDPIVSTSLRKVERERHRAKVSAILYYIRAFYYARKWRQLTWEKRLARKGRERRQNFAESMQALSTSSRGSTPAEPDPLASLLEPRQRLEDRSTNGASSMNNASAKRHSLPNISGTGSAKNVQSANGINPSRASDSITKQIAPHKVHHQRALTLGVSLRSTQSGRVNKQEAMLNASRSRMLSSQVHMDEALLKKARRLAAGRSDTTQTDYFRLKALGLDPDTPKVPRTLKRPRLSGMEDHNSRKTPRSTPPDTLMTAYRQQSVPKTIVSLAPEDSTQNNGISEQDQDEDLLARSREVRQAMAESTARFREEREKLSQSRSQSMEVGVSNSAPKKPAPSRTTIRLEKTGGHGLYNRIPRNQRWGKEDGSETDLPSREETPDAGPDAGLQADSNGNIGTSNSFGVLGYVFDDETSAEEVLPNADLKKGASVEDAIEL